MKYTAYFLAAAVVTSVALKSCEAEAACFRSDVKQLCCPSACAVKDSPKWYRANDTLAQCAKSLGCDSGKLSVFMVCGC